MAPAPETVDVTKGKESNLEAEDNDVIVVPVINKDIMVELRFYVNHHMC